MKNYLLRLGTTSCLAASLLSATSAVHAQGVPPVVAIADYQARLTQYQAARSAYEADATAYWSSVAENGRAPTVNARDPLPFGPPHLVFSQPPVYAGPPRPVDPQAPVPPPPERPEIPVVTDFLKNAAEQFGFVPDRPPTDLDFKRAY